MTSRRPYLLRAMHEWMSDNSLTPHVVVDAAVDGVEVPARFVSDGKIVLNVSLSATQGLSLGNEALSFNARFGGQPHQVYVPIGAVLGIYARESGQGMLFGDDDGDPDPHGPGDPGNGPGNGGDGSGSPRPQDDGPAPGERRSHLKVVK
jgi:stringent starvation protein B